MPKGGIDDVIDKTHKALPSYWFSCRSRANLMMNGMYFPGG
jgi:hypothetical protein